jgi:hypothetical protein
MSATTEQWGEHEPILLYYFLRQESYFTTASEGRGA